MTERKALPSDGTSRTSAERISLSIHTDLDDVADLWRAFEREADCTGFQTFGWLSAWMKHIGSRERVTPAVVVGRGADGAVLFLLPLAIEARGFTRRLVWLGAGSTDYNGPLLARDFASRIGARFPEVWREIGEQLRANSGLAFDAVLLDKLPEAIGNQPNPFLALGVQLNPSGAYLTHLSGDWESFYEARRSSSTRRRDRTKRKRLGDLGAIRFVTPSAAADIDATLSVLFDQKARSLAHMGVADMFARPGRADFFRDLATNPATAGMIHVSRLDVGTVPAATNLGLVFGRRYYHILASYDGGSAVARFGPGAAHLHELMQYAIEHGCSVFDFTIGDERYKRDWSDTELKLFDHHAAATWRGWAVALPSSVFAIVKRTIKQTPFLWRMFTALRARLGSLRRRRAEVDEAES